VSPTEAVEVHSAETQQPGRRRISDIQKLFCGGHEGIARHFKIKYFPPKSPKAEASTLRPHRAVVVVLLLLGLRLLLLGAAPLGAGAAPLLLLAATAPLLLLAARRVVAALAVGVQGVATAAFLRRLGPAHVHGLRRADRELLK